MKPAPTKPRHVPASQSRASEPALLPFTPSEAPAPQSIDLGATAAEKVAALHGLCQQNVPVAEPLLNPDMLNWRCWFYVYLMWHEGKQLTTRIQDPPKPGKPNGPGRGLMQFEPLSVWDTIDRYVYGPTKGLMARLANAAGVDLETVMKPALKAFRAAGTPVKAWPTSSPASQIEQWLLTNDEFGIELMQMYLALFKVTLPPLDLNNQTRNPRDAEFHEEFSEVWVDEWWKGKLIDRPDRIASFLSSAVALDKAVP